MTKQAKWDPVVLFAKINENEYGIKNNIKKIKGWLADEINLLKTHKYKFSYDLIFLFVFSLDTYLFVNKVKILKISNFFLIDLIYL